MNKTITILTLLILLPSVSAVSLRSADLSYDVDFKPGLKQDFEYFIRSNTDTRQDHEINVYGELAPYITLSQNNVNLRPGGEARVTATLKLPENPESLGPGKHTAEIRVTETANRGGGAMGVRTAAGAYIRVRAFYPDAYLMATANVPNGGVSQQLPIKIHAENWGDKPLKNVQAHITILDADEKEVETISSYKAELGPRESTDIVTLLDTLGYEVGEYVAEIDVKGDGQSRQLEEKFYLGTKSVTLVSMDTLAEADTINPLKIRVKSNWNSPLPVKTSIQLADGMIKTPEETVPARGETTITAYWDTTSLEEGDYPGKLKIQYEDGTIERDVVLTITGEIVRDTTNTTYLIAGIAALLIIVILGIMLWKK